QFSYLDSACGCSGSQVTGVTLANNATMSYVYDGLNRLVRQTDQLGNDSTYAYDPEGNLIKSINREGEEIDYQYDLDNRLITKTLPNANVTQLSYDTLGHLASASNTDAQLGFTYAGLGRLMRSVQTLPLLQQDMAPPAIPGFSYPIDYTYNEV